MANHLLSNHCVNVMTVPVDRIIAAKAADPALTLKQIAYMVGTSIGSVHMALAGKITSPRQLLKNNPKPFRKRPYAGYAGGREWNERGH